MFDIFTNPKRRKSLFVYIILGMICVVFVFLSDANFGAGGGGGRATGYAASVNDSIISMNELQMATEQVIRINSMFYGKDFGSTNEQRQMAMQDALRSLVSQELIAQAANESGLLVTKEEVATRIMTLPYLQQEGVFSREAYNFFLNSQRLSASQFESQLKKELLNNKVTDLFRKSLISSSLQQKKEDLAKSFVMQVKYINMNEDTLAAAAKISSDDVEKTLADESLRKDLNDFYALNQRDFQQEEAVKLRQILVQPKDGKWKQAEERIQAIRKDLNAENFAAMAKKHSDDPASKDAGGSLDYVTKGSMVPEIDSVAFQLDPQEVSQPIKTSYGYVVLLVEDRKAASKASFDEVKEEVARRYLAQQQAKATIAELNNLLKDKKVKEAESLVSTLKLKWLESPKFDLSGEALGPLAQVDGFIEESVRLDSENKYASRLLQSGPSYYMVKFASKEKVKEDKAKADMTASMQGDSAIRSWLQNLQQNATIEANLSALQ